MDRERRRRRQPQADHRADLRGKKFVCLPHAVLDSEAYRSLSPLARAILVEIARKFNGYNNGKLGIGQREIGERLGRQNYAAFARAIGELVSVGLIDIEIEGAWKPRKAREYRLTFCRSGKDGCQAATNEYLALKKEKIGGENASAVRSKTAEASPAAGKFRDETGSAAITENKGKVTFMAAEDGSSHIEKPYEAGFSLAEWDRRFQQFRAACRFPEIQVNMFAHDRPDRFEKSKNKEK